MKIILDLKKSMNNYAWESKEELNNWILEIQNTLWELYDNNEGNTLSIEENNRLYDILDMFTSYEIEDIEE